jgi:hypothetical protein
MLPQYLANRRHQIVTGWMYTCFTEWIKNVHIHIGLKKSLASSCSGTTHLPSVWEHCFLPPRLKLQSMCRLPKYGGRHNSLRANTLISSRSAMSSATSLHTACVFQCCSSPVSTIKGLQPPIWDSICSIVSWICSTTRNFFKTLLGGIQGQECQSNETPHK